MRNTSGKNGIFWFGLDRRRKYIRTKQFFPLLVLAVVITIFCERPIPTKIFWSLAMISVYFIQLLYYSDKWKKGDTNENRNL